MINRFLIVRNQYKNNCQSIQNLNFKVKENLIENRKIELYQERTFPSFDENYFDIRKSSWEFVDSYSFEHKQISLKYKKEKFTKYSDRIFYSDSKYINIHR